MIWLEVCRIITSLPHNRLAGSTSASKSPKITLIILPLLSDLIYGWESVYVLG